MGPTTETRSRDEWLAEVKRRGGRLRRRRQLTMAVVGALALVLPVSAVTTLLRGEPDRDVSQLVAGPGPTTAPAAEVAPSSGIEAGAAGQIPSSPVEPVTTTTLQPAPVGPLTAPADDPVGRPAPATTVPSGGGITATQSPLPTTTVPTAPTESQLAPCVAAEFRLTVSMEKSSYRRGETVSGSSTLEKRSPGRYLLPNWWIEISFLNDAARDVSQTALSSSSSFTSDQASKWDPCGSSDCPRPVQPGPVFTNTFSWETVDCSTNYPTGPIVPAPGDTSYCAPFPAGTYTVVADWVGPQSGPPARAAFQLNA